MWQKSRQNTHKDLSYNCKNAEHYEENYATQLIYFLLYRREALHYWKQRNGTKATYRRLIRVFEQAGYQGYADEVRRIAQLSDSETDDSSGSGEEQSQPEQPTYPPTKNLEALPQVLPNIPNATETYVTITDESLSESKELTKYQSMVLSFCVCVCV